MDTSADGSRSGKQKSQHHRSGQSQGKHRRKSRFISDNEVDIDLSIQEEIEHGNYKLRGRKTKVSINHLLDFQLPEIERTAPHRPRSSRQTGNGYHQHLHLHGESFVNANYRFLVKSGMDYTAQTQDANIPIPQENIVRVIVPRGQSCPICLTEEPIAPHMVSCGHIFCLPCLKNFFNVQETIKNPETGYTKPKKYKECPLCGSIIRPNTVKPVLFSTVSPELPVPGSKISLKLLCRPEGHILSLPVSLGIDPKKVGDIPHDTVQGIDTYARIIQCSTEHSIAMLQDDIEAIETQHEIDKALYNDPGKFSTMAIGDLNNSIAQLVGATDEDTMVNGVHQLEINSEQLKSKYNDKTAFFYYQTSFGIPTKFLLSPLDIKILLRAYKHYSQFPDSLELKVENVHYGTVVTEELIRKYKYIGHLPLGTELAFIDVDWRDHNAIPKEVYDEFAPELKQRRRTFNLKSKREDKQKQLYQTQLEKQHSEFYKRENGELTNYSDISVGAATPQVESLMHSKTAHNDQLPIRERTIWGTSIDIQPDEKVSREDREFEAMLMQKIQDPVKTRKSKKNKVVLFSSDHQTQ